MDGVTEAYIYDSADLGDNTSANPALTFRAGELVKRWLFGPQVDEPLAYEAYTGTTTPGSGSVIELLANRLGSIITAISVSTGAVAADYDYQAYGARVETGALEQPYGFTGREHDAESGLIHLRARAYDPVAGVFLQVDPIEIAGGSMNLTSYLANDPLNGTDPSGMTESLSWRQMSMGSAALTAAAAWGSADGDKTLFGSVINLAQAISTALSQIVPGVYPQPMSDAGAAATPPDGHDPCKGDRRQLRTHLQKLDDWWSNPYAADNGGLLRYGNPLLDMFHIVHRSISLQRQVMTWTYKVRKCEKENGM